MTLFECKNPQDVKKIFLEKKEDKKSILDITDEMTKFFEKRTREHIDRVKTNLKTVEDAYPKEFKGLVELGSKHDESKFGNPEKDPYIVLTWKKKIEREGFKYDVEGLDDILDSLTEATAYHVKNNPHHPEYWSKQTKNLINTKDRDKPPEEIIKAHDMPLNEIAHMCCDWQGMSQEFGEGNYKKWADDNIGVRWDFTEEQKEVIYRLLKLWEK